MNLGTSNALGDDREYSGGFLEPSLPLAVVLARTRWDEPPRMRHHITRQLMRWFNVLFIESFPTQKREPNMPRWWQACDRLVIYAPRSPVRVPARLYANDPMTHKAVNLYFAKRIVNKVRSQACQTPIFFNFVYDFYEIMRDEVFAYKVYVCFDEFPRMQRRTHKRNAIKARYQAELFQCYENRVAQGANRCLTPHYPLREKLRKVNDNVDMLFHAHDYALLPVHAPRKRTGTINVAYAGYIDWRLLTDWLVTVLQEQDMNLHMIGPVSRRFDLPELTSYSSMHYISTLAEDQLLHKLTEMDVLVIPYDPAIPEVAIYTTNSKTFQYIAAGKPVVISDLPHYIEFPHGVIYRAKDALDFVAQVRRAYRQDCEEYVDLRKRIASENTWDSRGDQLLALLKRDLPLVQELGAGKA